MVAMYVSLGLHSVARIQALSFYDTWVFYVSHSKEILLLHYDYWRIRDLLAISQL
jgi:hypothetical protein